MPNRLQHESSLYLRQHANNPVDWYPWGEEALARAKAEGKPVFLSIGYSACHWCHVMEHESFEDEDTAKVMNDLFVNIKVDREERPDLDAIYMNSLQMLTREGGGWPLSVFLTPEGRPFHAGTYFPPRDQYGRPSFRRVLLAVAQAWDNKREQLEDVGAKVSEALAHSVEAGDGELNETTLRNAMESLKRSYEPKHGGFGRAPKFPHPMDLRLLLILADRFQDPAAKEMVRHTLTFMARGGIYDHLGGGFARYSVDEKWLVPHFEKMLYDNALLVPVYVEAFQITGDEYYCEVAEDVLRFTQAEMTSPLTGAFYSTLDADSEGVEGKYYVWTMQEIEELLGDDAEIAKAVWGVTEHGNFEEKNILFRSRSDKDDAKRLGLDVDAFQRKLDDIRHRLLSARSKRIKPGRDEKFLTAWNALMITAFAKAGTVLSKASYLGSAFTAMEYVLTTLRQPDGRLLRTAGDHHPAKLAAYLEDYAYLIESCLALYETAFDIKWLDTAKELAETMIRDYHDAERGGFYFSIAGADDLIARTKDWHDGSTPSGNAMAATVLLKLAALLGNDNYRTIAEGTLQAFGTLLNESPAAAGQMLTALDFALGPVQEVAVLGPANSETNQVINHFRQYHPRRVMAYSSTGDDRIALFRNRQMADGRVTTWVCSGGVCAAPVVGSNINT